MLKRTPLPGVAGGAGASGAAGTLVVAVAIIASAAVASVVISYPTPSDTALSLKAPPVVWSAGPDSSGNGFVASWTLSSNQTYYSVTLKPVPEANVTWGNLTTLKNQDTAAWNVVVSGTSVAANTKIVGFRLEFYAYGTDALLGAMNLTAGSPSVNLGSLSAGSSCYVKAYIQLATNTAASDLPASVAISLTLT